MKDRASRVWLTLGFGALLGCGGASSPGGPSADAAALDEGAVDAAGVDRVADDVRVPHDTADGSSDGATDAPDGSSGPTGSFLTLTYNVAGLPWGLSSSDPYRNTPLISPLLNPYDLALLQEDFSFTTQLSSAATHPYKSVPGAPGGLSLNDGLTVFSRLPFANVTREAWEDCSGFISGGSDCLAAKGFLVTELTVASGVVLDVYDLHMDAGQDGADYDARTAQVEQLVASLTTRSAGKAVVLGGDTNLKLTSAVDNAGLLDRLLAGGGLTDACRALGCGDERIDRIMVRSSASLELVPLSWALDGTFVDGQGAPLSDHEAVAVRIGWTVR
jgi:endonuclease/exonuclease/phosphatase family metal-dependent hydrolase